MPMFYTWTNIEELVEHFRQKAGDASDSAKSFGEMKKKSPAKEKRAEAMAWSQAADTLSMSYFEDISGRVHKPIRKEEKL